MQMSVTISWPAKTTQMVKFQRLDFSNRVLQRFRQFQSECFLMFSGDLFHFSYKALVYLLILGPCVPVGCFSMQKLKFFVFFSLTSKMKPMCVESPSFLQFFAMMGLWFCTCRRKPCKCQWRWRRRWSPFFSRIPALKIRRHFTGTAAENIVSTFPVKRSYRRYFCG